MERFNKEVEELYIKLLNEVPDLKETIKQKEEKDRIDKQKKIEYNREYKKTHRNQRSKCEVDNDIQNAKKVMTNSKAIN